MTRQVILVIDTWLAHGLLPLSPPVLVRWIGTLPGKHTCGVVVYALL